MKITAVALLALTAALPTAAFACPDLKIEGGWIRQAPPGAMMTAAYGTLTNAGRQPLQVERASAAGFDGAELHRSWVENGMHRMSEGTLSLAPGQTVALEPGGWHLMLFQPPTLVPGRTVPVTFHCGGSSSRSLFEIRAP